MIPILKNLIREILNEDREVPKDEWNHLPKIGQSYDGPNGKYEIITYGPNPKSTSSPMRHSSKGPHYKIKFNGGKEMWVKPSEKWEYFKYEYLVK